MLPSDELAVEKSLEDKRMECHRYVPLQYKAHVMDGSKILSS